MTSSSREAVPAPPAACPRCGHRGSVKRVVYGMVPASLRDSDVILAGCVLDAGELAFFRCRECHAGFRADGSRMTRHVVVHVPHASRVIPPEVRQGIALGEEALSHELDLMTDSFTDVIAARAAELAEESGDPLIVMQAPLSRLVVDVERFPDEREVMNSVGMGAIYTRTHDGAVLRSEVDESLLERYFTPHARAMGEVAEQVLDRHGHLLLVDLHSYPSERLPYEVSAPHSPRPEICLGVDPTHTPADLVHRATASFTHAGFGVAVNTPFAGTYVPAEVMRDTRVSSLMVEIRRDVYLDESAMRLDRDAVDVLARALQGLW